MKGRAVGPAHSRYRQLGNALSGNLGKNKEAIRSVELGHSCYMLTKWMAWHSGNEGARF